MKRSGHHGDGRVVAPSLLLFCLLLVLLLAVLLPSFVRWVVMRAGMRQSPIPINQTRA